ncbi:MAG TPA: cytoplasmic protein [Longimicrobium sp.]|nr:cytoplasmic protein [Longimicrobium sp.]
MPGWPPPAAENDVRAAHRFSSRHRAQVMASDLCACFHCRATFAPAEIEEWVDDGQTALCPRCGIDAVLGSACPYPLTPAFLERMRRHWFDTPGPDPTV